MGNVEKAGATLAPKKSEALEGDGNTQPQGQDAGRLDSVAGPRERWVCRQDLGRGGPEVASPARTSRVSDLQINPLSSPADGVRPRLWAGPPPTSESKLPLF